MNSLASPAFRVNHWLKLSMLSLGIVSILGVIMRIKIAFSFPWFDQKHLQLAHSHLAFMAWVSQTLWIFIVDSLKTHLDEKQQNKFNVLIGINFLAIWLLCLCFLAVGYHPLTFVFLGIQLLVSVLLILHYFKSNKGLTVITSKYIFNWGMIFQVLASLGSIALVLLMVSKQMSQHQYLATTYWYLHFSYNGWFLFACLGLWQNYLVSSLNQSPIPKNLLLALLWSCLPAYGLSVLWLKLPNWLYILVIISALVQAISWILIVRFVLQKINLNALFSKSALSKYVLLFVSIALSIKWLLQLGSVIPAISKLAFGFRPVVIAYLHLILLAVVSVFLFGYAHFNAYFEVTQNKQRGIWLFMIGVLLNEILLAIQGIASFSYMVIPHMNEGLLFAAILLLFASLLMQPISKKIK